MRPGGDVWITHDLTDNAVAHVDLAALARHFNQRYCAAVSN
ncbi:hypothetical protein [Gemmatimonas sp.]